jgi:hypothetical protein
MGGAEQLHAPGADVVNFVRPRRSVVLVSRAA